MKRPNALRKQPDQSSGTERPLAGVAEVAAAYLKFRGGNNQKMNPAVRTGGRSTRLAISGRWKANHWFLCHEGVSGYPDGPQSSHPATPRRQRLRCSSLTKITGRHSRAIGDHGGALPSLNSQSFFIMLLRLFFSPSPIQILRFCCTVKPLLCVFHFRNKLMVSVSNMEESDSACCDSGSGTYKAIKIDTRTLTTDAALSAMPALARCPWHGPAHVAKSHAARPALLDFCARLF